MWELRQTSDGWAVARERRKAPTWGGAVLFTFGTLWALGGLVQIFTGIPAVGLFIFVMGAGIAALGYVLISRFSEKVNPVRLLVAAQPGAGGVLVTVVDDSNARHDLVTDHATATALQSALEARGA